jgi:glycerol-3-phosphate acyltransferase PlsY
MPKRLSRLGWITATLNAWRRRGEPRAMSDDLVAILVCLLGYLLGSIPFGLLLTKLSGLGDIRSIGSGNIGATNVLRTGRKGLAAATLVLDGLKGAAAVLIARAWLDDQDTVLLAGLAAVLGHLFPVWLRFKGGKGVATGLGVLIAAAWPIGLAACAVWLVVAAISRFSSLAALAAFASAPCVALGLEEFGVVKLSFTVAVLVFVRHRANIRRLLAGTEPRIGRSKTGRA